MLNSEPCNLITSMSMKRKIAMAGMLLCLAVALIVGLLAAAYLYLPVYLESKIIPRIASDAGLTDFSIDVRNVGFFSADLGTLRIGPPENPALIVGSVQVDYSPRGLYHQKIRQITLSGIEFHGEIKEGRFTLRGVDLENLLAGATRKSQTESPRGGTGPTVSLAKLSVRNSRAVVTLNERFYRLPFEFDILPRDEHFNELDIAARLYPRGEAVGLVVKVNLLRRRAALRLESTILELGRFADLTAQLSDLGISGLLEMNAIAELEWNPLRISAVDASLKLRHGNITGGGFHLQTPADTSNGTIPFRFRLSGSRNKVWQVSGGSLLMTVPVHLSLSEFGGKIQQNGARLAAAIDFRATLPSSEQIGNHRFPVSIRDPIPLQGRLSAEYHQTGRWQCVISSVPLEGLAARAVRLDAAPCAITSAPPAFKLSAKSEAEQIEADYSLSVPSLRISLGSESITIPGLIFEGDARTDGGFVGTNFKLRAPNSGINLQDAKIKIPKLAVSGRLNRTVDRQITAKGLLEFSGASGRSQRFSVRGDGARGKIPFQWPPAEKTAKGALYINKLRFKNMELGSIHSEIRQTMNGFEFKGRHQSVLLPRLKSRFSGSSSLYGKIPLETSVQIEVSRAAAAPEIDLGRFAPDARGIRIKGKFQLTGDLTLNSNGFGGNLRADFNNGNLRSERNKLSLEGIRLTLSLPELPKLRSAPGQQLHFNRIAFGEFVAQNGRIDFQIESEKSLLLEKMRFRWCDGNVETQSMRLTPAAKDWHVTFYCDRLNLAKVLEQFGAAAAEGQGTVNGRIPLAYAGGKIRFDDGFLFSTPGEGGKIRLTGTDILTAGIPPDTAQYVQMELAKEALKDYDYSWAKLNLTSRGEDLLLQMQMDGKPAKTLPFVYKKDIGGFMKVEANAKGSKFQGIRLDVNFRLPLNKLLQYKELIDMIQ